MFYIILRDSLLDYLLWSKQIPLDPRPSHSFLFTWLSANLFAPLNFNWNDVALNAFQPGALSDSVYSNIFVKNEYLFNDQVLF